jgi:hypothetical protein
MALWNDARQNVRECASICKQEREFGMSEDPSSPRHEMGRGLAVLAAIAVACGIAVMFVIYL